MIMAFLIKTNIQKAIASFIIRTENRTRYLFISVTLAPALSVVFTLRHDFLPTPDCHFCMSLLTHHRPCCFAIIFYLFIIILYLQFFSLIFDFSLDFTPLN